MSNLSYTQKDKKANNGFTSIPNFLLRDNKLTDKEYRVLMVLISWWNREKKMSWPGGATIETQAQVSETWRKHVLNSLEKKQYVKREFSHGHSNGYTFPQYFFPKEKTTTHIPKKKKPYFRGMEIVNSRGRTYCISKQNEWLQFAGNWKDVEYK